MPDQFPFNGADFGVANVKTKIDLDRLRQGFRDVPVDEYVADGTRHKDIWRCKIVGGRLTSTPHAPLFYTEHPETYRGETSRHYREIPDGEITALRAVVEIFAAVFRVGEEHEFLIQRQRVVVQGCGTSQTVQEGVHRDGVSGLGMLCVARTNVTGGISLVYHRRGDGAVGDLAFAGTLEAGDMLFLDDTKLLHDATPIRNADPQHPGSRDMILITFPACRERPSNVSWSSCRSSATRPYPG